MSEDTFSSTLEMLSVELWREIFEYLNSYSLWYSFRGLNRRIDAIIDQTALYFNFKKKGTYGYFMKTILQSMKAINVRSLNFMNLNEIRHFFSNFSLDSLIRLRSLSLNFMYSFNDNSFTFWNQLSSLKHLQVLKIMSWDFSIRSNCVEEKKYIIYSIFNKGYCPLLKCFVISTGGVQQGTHTIPLLIPTTKTTNIQYLSIDALTFNDLMKLLPALQKVKLFCVDYQLTCDDSFNELHQPIIVDMPLLPKCIDLHLKLSDNITLEHIEYLLKQTPSLKKSFIWGWYHLLDANRWEYLLSMYCTKLRSFQLICTGPTFSDSFDQSIDDFEQTCQKSPFWNERNVIISCDKDFSAHDYRDDVNIEFNIKNNVSLIRNILLFST
ncbi:unnamed protein product [Rotaria sp. Silwood1]|nr:unnamed protein product [Rotaria sp. Silwood1]CAF4843320.1 unnamed protein product [Rotaria sp. Silwood1]